MYTRISKPLASLVLAALTAGVTGTAFGGGFSITEHGVKGLGTAYAGAAALAEDGSTVFWNPAGMTRLEGIRIDTAGHIILPSSEFTNGASRTNAAFGGAALPGTAQQDPGIDALVPNLYVVGSIGKNTRLGVAIDAPFGLKTSYDDGWVGRYHALTSSLKTFNINPAIAHRFDGGLSFGVGLSIQYADARLSNSIDKAGVCLGSLTPALGAAGAAGACTAAGLSPALIASGAADGNIDLEADDWSFGWNVGILYEFTQGTRFGLHYRSGVDHDLDGTGKFTNTADLAALLGGGRFTNQGGSAELDLPEAISASVYHRMTDKLAILGDVTYTGWDSFDSLVVNFDGGHPRNVTPQSWDDVWRFSLGASYDWSKTITLRAGVAYDEEPIPSATLRTPRIPGDDRTWLTFGASFAPWKHVTVDVGYAHIFVGDVSINNAEVNTGHVLVGEYDADTDIISGQVNYRFR